MLGDEVGERAEAARAGARGGEVEPRAVGVERVRQRLDARHRMDRRDREHGRAVAERAQRRAQVAHRALGDRAEVGLGDDEHVGDLHDPRLEELEDVARARLDDDRHRVGRLRHLGLGLAHADRLDDDDVEGGAQRLGRGARRGREAAEALARRHRADEQRAVGGVGVDPRPVAQQGAARALRRRVDREHADAPPASAPDADERAEQRRLARARRPGDPDHVRGRLAAEPGRRHLGEQRVDLRAPRRRAVLEQVERRRRRGEVALAQPGAELGAAHAAAAMPLRSATMPTTSRRIRVSSKSFGV